MGKKKTPDYGVIHEPVPFVPVAPLALPEEQLDEVEDPGIAPHPIKLVGLVRSAKLGSLPGYKLVTIMLDPSGEMTDIQVSKQAYLIQEAKHRVEMALEEAVRETRRA